MLLHNEADRTFIQLFRDLWKLQYTAH